MTLDAPKIGCRIPPIIFHALALNWTLEQQCTYPLSSFKVGSFNYPINKMMFLDEFIADEKQIRSVLDYNVGINELSKKEKRYSAITGELQASPLIVLIKYEV